MTSTQKTENFDNDDSKRFPIKVRRLTESLDYEFVFGKREYGEIVVERDYIESGRAQSLLLCTQIYNKNSQAKDNFLIIHGIVEHSGRYLGIGKMLAENDFAFYMIDLSGYGLSGV